MRNLDATTLRVRVALKGAFLGLIGTALVIASAAILVWPLWYLATTHTGIYTLLMLVAIVGGLVYVACGKIKRHKADSASPSIGP